MLELTNSVKLSRYEMKRVLIIDDEELIREFMEDYFKTRLHFDKIVLANDGLEAFIKASLEKFDIICCDHYMPLMKGAQFLLALREKSGINQKTPVIMVSSYIPEISTDLQTIENTYFLEKPVEFSRLARYVKMAMPKEE